MLLTLINITTRPVIATIPLIIVQTITTPLGTLKDEISKLNNMQENIVARLITKLRRFFIQLKLRIGSKATTPVCRRVVYQ